VSALDLTVTTITIELMAHRDATTRARTRTGVTAEEHLRKADRTLGAIVEEVMEEEGGPLMLEPDPAHEPDPNMPTDRYATLLRGIVSQNLSNIASRAIWFRLLGHFRGHPPTPKEIVATDPDVLHHEVGLSSAKTVSFRSLADHIESGELDLDHMDDLPDDEVVRQLSAVKGIGAWTADMFLMFHLFRPDVLPVGDLSLRHAVQHAYGFAEVPRPPQMEHVAEPWRPYRSYAAVYLWAKTHATPQV